MPNKMATTKEPALLSLREVEIEKVARIVLKALRYDRFVDEVASATSARINGRTAKKTASVSLGDEDLQKIAQTVVTTLREEQSVDDIARIIRARMRIAH